MNKLLVVPTLIVVIIAGGVFLVNRNTPEKGQDPSSDKIVVTQYKSPTCGCCVEHAAYLRRDNFDVDTKPTQDMVSIKEEYNIPNDVQSCHTEIIGDYFVEGHVPVEAINKLLAEKPDIDGIALPGMPAGSPGMPGIKTAEFVIYALKDGETSEFMRI